MVEEPSNVKQLSQNHVCKIGLKIKGLTLLAILGKGLGKRRIPAAAGTPASAETPAIAGRRHQQRPLQQQGTCYIMDASYSRVCNFRDTRNN